MKENDEYLTTTDSVSPKVLEKCVFLSLAGSSSNTSSSQEILRDVSVSG